MPIYSFNCIKCGDFDVLQGMRDPVPRCPACSSLVKKLVTRFGFKLVGDNWSSKEAKIIEAAHLEKAFEKEEKQLLRQGHKVFPKGTSRAGDII